MEPFIALGLKGADNLIDKHFHKIPDKYVRGETYKPNILSKKKRSKKRNSGTDKSYHHKDVDSASDIEEVGDMQHTYRDRDVAGIPAYSQDSPYITPPLFSREPPLQRPQYVPSPPPMGGGYGAPPPRQPGDRSSQRRDIYDDGNDYYSDSYRSSTRPQPMRRRSSSYHGPRTRDDRYDRQVQRRTGSGSETLDKARDRAHRYGLKDEVEDLFTSSKAGLGGGALGAVVGGWAAQKAQVGYGKGKHKEGNSLLTLLGAAAGGIAANVLVERWEESKKDGNGDGKERDDRSSSDGHERSSESGRGRKDRRSGRSNDYDNDGYD